MKQWQWIALLAGGAVAVVSGVVLLEKKSSAATPTPTPVPTPPPAPSPTPIGPTGASTITLIPNQSANSYPSVMGNTVTVQLPSGASWINNGSGPTVGNMPVTWTYQGPGTVNFTWVDASMQPQTTALSFYTVVE